MSAPTRPDGIDQLPGSHLPVLDASAVAELPVGLPMPRNPALLLGGAPRVRVRTLTDRFPFPVPNGWFVVAEAAGLAPGAVVPVHYFGRDLVVFRTDAGAAHVVDAYCPHLGAHVGVGGKVDGDGLRCPFHGWRFDGTSGRCTEIPYSSGEHIPSQARLGAYPTIERHGMVWAWHHLTGGDPFFELPTVAEFDSPDWGPTHLIEFAIATSCQEMAENNHDFAHFMFVHGTEQIPPSEEELVEGTYKRVRSPGLERETFGLGLGVVRVPGIVTFLSSVTPVDTDNVHVRWLFTVPVASPPGTVEALAGEFAAGVSQDIPIWENKTYRPRPVLTKAEAGILAHRRWSAQFYSEPVESPPAAELEGDGE